MKPAGMRRVPADSSVVGAGVHTGLPWCLCGCHKMTIYRLLAADVM